MITTPLNYDYTQKGGQDLVKKKINIFVYNLDGGPVGAEIAAGGERGLFCFFVFVFSHHRLHQRGSAWEGGWTLPRPLLPSAAWTEIDVLVAVILGSSQVIRHPKEVLGSA